MAYTDFLDPEPAQFAGDTLLERISRAYEEAVDAYGNACDKAALAENEFLKLHAQAWVRAVEDNIAATVRDKHCKAQPEVVEAHMAWNRALATEKRGRSKVQEMQTRMTAAMAHQRFVREAS